MAVVTHDFQKEILDAMKDYSSLARPVKASFLERMFIEKAPVLKLYPNPDDEFTNPEIGPNYEIVGNYVDNIVAYDKYSRVPKIEPIIVEKISTGGYMILNGHHRWLAVKRLNMKYIPIHIVNPTHEADILTTMKKLNSSRCVSFDLDEVLVGNGDTFEVERLHFPANKIFTMPVRKNAALLISALQEMGFDIWVYTGSYYTPQFVKMTFKMHKAKIDGVITGMNRTQFTPAIKDTFRKKYNTVVHIDNERLMWVNSKTKDFDSYELPQDEKWASASVDYVREIIKSGKVTND